MFPQKHTSKGLFYALSQKVLGYGIFCVLAFILLFSSVFAIYTYTRSLTGEQKAYAATSDTLNFQGRLLNSSGGIVPDGYYNLQFKIYDTATDGTGTNLWTESYYDSNGVTAGNDNRARVVNGYFSVNLGSQTAFSGINWDQQLWLTMNVGGTTQTATPTYDGEMLAPSSQRTKLTAVPYAFKAESANSVTTNNTNAASTNSSNITIQSGNAAGATSNSGNISIDVGTATQTAGTISIGTTNTSAITIGRAGVVTTLNGSVTVAGGTNYGVYYRDGSGNLATTAAGTSGECFKANTGAAPTWGSCTGTGDFIQNGNAFSANAVLGTNDAFALQFETQNNVQATIAVGGATTFQNSADSTAAFSIQNSSSNSLFLVNTTGSAVTLGAGGSSTYSSTVNIANTTDGTGTQTVSIGSTANSSNTTTIQGGTGATAVSIQAGATGTIAIGTANSNNVTLGSSSSTGTITIGQSTATNTINIGSSAGASGTQTINIGTSATASSTTNVTIGSIIAGATTLQSQTTNINSATIATNQSTLSLFDNNATTVTAFQAATSISLGATTGTLTVRNANTTLGSAAGSGLFINNGATRNTVLSLGDFATGGSIGAASTNVDIYTYISVAQTTASQTLTLPAPTSTTAGRFIYITNTGSANFNLIPNGGSTQILLVGSSVGLIWDGTKWTSTGDGNGGVLSVGTIDGGSYSANGASISGTTIYLQTASATQVGLVNTGAQTLAGAKTFSSLITGQAGIAITGATVSLNDSSNFNTSINGGTSTGAVSIGNNSAGAITLQSASTIGLTGNTTVTAATGAGTALTVKGNTSSASLGSELVTSQDFTNATYWSCTGWTTSVTDATHNTGNTNTCVATASNLTVSSGVVYQVEVTYSATNSSADYLDVSIGGESAPWIVTGSNTLTAVVETTTTGSLTFTPTSGFDGTISGISVKLVTPATTVLSVVNSDSSSGIEVRSGGSTLSNTFIGINSGRSNISGDNNTSLGAYSLQSNTGGYKNTAIGKNTLFSNTTGFQNTALGASSLYWNTTGYNNVALGTSSLSSNTVGNYNIAIGVDSLNTSLDGSRNLGIGFATLTSNISGSDNVALGNETLANTSTDGNTAVGVRGLYSNTTGTYNASLGYYAGYTDGAFATSNNLQEATAIGAYSQVQQSNSLILGRSATGTNQTLVGIGTTAPTDLFSVSPIFYNTGTAGTGGSSSTTVTGSGTTWTSAMVGMEIIFSDGTKATITAFGSATSLTVSPAITVANGTAYRIHNRAFYVTATGSAAFRSSTNSATAFQLQNASGTSLFTVDTSGSNLSIGNSSAGTTTINSPTFTVGASAGASLFINNGATRNTVLTLGNFPTGGSIGAASTNVDIYTYIGIAQTTASQTLTVPAPTSATAGRFIYITNTGSADFNITPSGGSTHTVLAGASLSLIWDGSKWTSSGDGNGGVNTIGAIDGGSYSANGASISGTTLYLQTASGTQVGLVNTGAQTFAGAKTFSSLITGQAGITITGAAVSLNDSSNFNTSINGGTSTGNVTIGNSAAGTISLQSASTIGLTGNTTITAATGTGVALTVNNSTSTGNILNLQDSGTNVVTVADGGAITFKNSGNSTSAFLIQDSSNNPVLNVDTTNGRIGINTSTPSADLTFGEGATRSVNVLTRTTNATGSGLTITAGAAGSGASAFAGGTLTLQGGAAGGTGNANGGSVSIAGGAGVGTGAQGLVNLSTTAFTSSSTVTLSSSNSLNTLLAGAVDLYATIPVDATGDGYTLTVNLPSITTVGRVLYVTAVDGSSDFTLSLAGTAVDINMKANSTATLIYNGTGWTAAGASSSTDLQAAYNNTLSSAGAAELVLNAPGGSADGLTIRNNATTPIVGAIFEAQTSIGSNLFSVNNNATEYADNGGAESSTFTAWTGAPAGGTVTRTTTSGEYATGQAGTKVVTAATADQGVENTLVSTLTPNLEYSVAFTVKGSSNFTTLDVIYSRDGTNTSTTTCSSSNTVTQSVFSRINCTFTAPSSGITSSNSIFIRQSDAVAHTYYIDNLSVTINASVNHAVDGSADTAANIGGGTNNWASVSGSTVTQSTSVLYDTSGSVSVATSATSGRGVYNKLSNNIAPSLSTQYRVAFYARGDGTNTATLAVAYTPDNGSSSVSCQDYNTQTVSASAYTLISCYFTTDATSVSNAQVRITQSSGSATTFYVDALTVTLNTNNSNNVQIGGGSDGGPTTLFTLDRASSAPIAANNDAYLGSMYYDTSTGRIQCYEADGWGACGAAPDNYVNLNPEYAGAVLNGTGVGTMTADFCANQSGVLQVNYSASTDPCYTSGDVKNYYKWTSPQATQQTYSIYVTYQLPSTFNGFSSDDTVQLVARADSTSNAAVTYQMFYRASGAGSLTQCGSGETTVVSSANTWQSVGINGNESTGCTLNSALANGLIIFKINMKANSNASAYVSTLSFVTTGR